MISSLCVEFPVSKRGVLVVFLVVFFMTAMQNVFSLIIKFINLDAAELMLRPAQHRDGRSKNTDTDCSTHWEIYGKWAGLDIPQSLFSLKPICLYDLFTKHLHFSES